jgi:hypothetical protein
MAMARAKQKITLSPSRDIPFDRLVLSQSNVRRVKAGVSIGELADDIARRTLLQGLNVRPLLGEDGSETGMFEIPAGGRRYRALELLVKQKRLAKDAPVPCIVQQAAAHILAEEDSYAENAVREALHPLDQFRAMQAMVAKGNAVETIAAHFMTTPAVVRQRLKLASVSPALQDLYAEDDMTLDQLMAFTVDALHKEYILCGGIEVGQRLFGAPQQVARFQRIVRIGAGDILLLEAVMRRLLAARAGPRPFLQERARGLREIGAGLVADAEIAFRGEEAAEALLDEIGDVLRMRVAAEEAREARALLGQDRLGSREAPEPVPIVGRDRIGGARAAPAFILIVKVHAPCLPVRGKEGAKPGVESRLTTRPQPLARRLGHASRPPGRDGANLSASSGRLNSRHRASHTRCGEKHSLPPRQGKRLGGDWSRLNLVVRQPGVLRSIWRVNVVNAVSA